MGRRSDDNDSDTRASTGVPTIGTGPLALYVVAV
jgi:hypothetical protein